MWSLLKWGSQDDYFFGAFENGKDNHKCPNEVCNSWLYWDGDNWIEAKDGLKVKCVNNKGNELLIRHQGGNNESLKSAAYF